MLFLTSCHYQSILTHGFHIESNILQLSDMAAGNALRVIPGASAPPPTAERQGTEDELLIHPGDSVGEDPESPDESTRSDDGESEITADKQGEDGRYHGKVEFSFSFPSFPSLLSCPLWPYSPHLDIFSSRSLQIDR